MLWSPKVRQRLVMGDETVFRVNTDLPAGVRRVNESLSKVARGHQHPITAFHYRSAEPRRMALLSLNQRFKEVPSPRRVHLRFALH